MPLGMEVGLGPGNFVLLEERAPPFQKGTESPQFSAHVYCGQTAGWIKMPLGMEVGLGPGNFLLDADPPPLPKKGAEPPIFGQCSLWIHQGGILIHPGRWTKMPLGIEVGRPRPR